MQKAATWIAVLSLLGLCACAVVPPPTATTSSVDQGDRELSRGVYWYHQGCTTKAMEHFYAAHEFYNLTDQQAGRARSLISLANLYRQAGNQKNALLFYDAAVEAARRSDNQLALVQALSGDAGMRIEMGELKQATGLLDEAQTLSRTTGSVYASILNHRAVIQMKQDNDEQALELLSRAEKAVVDADSRIGAAVRFTRGRLMMKTGENEAAMKLFQQALKQDRRSGFKRGMADDLLAMADIHEKSDQAAQALDCLERSLNIHALIGNRKTVADQLKRLEALSKQTGSDIRVTLHFLKQWLAGEGVDVVCR